MPIVGRQEKTMTGNYDNSPLKAYAGAFRDLANEIVTEGADIFLEPAKSMMRSGVNESMKNFFIENSIDQHEGMTTDEYNDQIEMMNEQYENDKQALLEYASMSSYNPVIGISFPMHKLMLMNNIFDKGAIQKAVAKSPKFTITMEHRYLVTPDGQLLDLSIDQMRLTDAINNTRPFKEVEITTLPENKGVNVIQAIGGTEGTDNLSVDTYISAVQVEIDYKAGDKDSTGAVIAADTTMLDWVPVALHFTPGYGPYERTLMMPVDFTKLGVNITSAVKQDVVNAAMDNGRFIVNTNGIIKGVKIKAKRDASNGLLQTCSATWKTVTDIVEIENATPINVPISPEEVKDLAALYNVNQLTKIMTIIKDVLENYKDDTIRRSLDDSWVTMDPSQKKTSVFDMLPREGYALDHVEYRHKSFMDILDSHVTDLVMVLNDPNVTVSIFGRPDLIRKITPTEYSYQSPSSIGPVELEFTRTIVTSDKRIYQFISSQKYKDSNELVIILNPRNSDRIIYRIYDYQLYVSNEIRNVKNYTLPAVHAFERFKFKAYQPVQGRVRILNPTGYKEN